MDAPVIIALLLACTPAPVVLARGVVVPESATARFDADVNAPVPGAGVVGHGGLAVAAEGRARVQLLGPLGGAGLLLLSDGASVSAFLPASREAVVAPEADAVLLEVGAGGIVGLTDLLRGVVRPPEGVDGDDRATWRGANDTRVTARFDRGGHALDLRVEDADGTWLLDARWRGRDDSGLPGDIDLWLPRVATRLRARELRWSPGPVDAALFVAPEGFRVVSGRSVVRDATRAAMRARAQAAGYSPPEASE